VMTGMGRTGYWFAVEAWDVIPDMICLAKGLSGGYLPLSITAARGEWVELVWEKLGDFNHGSTFSHQPVAAAVGLATLDYLEAHDLIRRAEMVGAKLGEKLHAAFDDHPHIGDVRGRGMMWTVELVADRATKAPFPPADGLANRVFKHAFADGLIVYAMGGCVDGKQGDHVMVSPPFVVEEDQLDEIITLFKGAIEAALQDIA
jgi:adenosylmethionine-8-amino-7-oxononanoate aminotransferase